MDVPPLAVVAYAHIPPGGHRFAMRFDDGDCQRQRAVDIGYRVAVDFFLAFVEQRVGGNRRTGGAPQPIVN